jgi:ER membrane protein complex subunit 1
VDTVIFHLDAVTGEDVLGVSPRDAILEGSDIIQGPLIDAYMLSAANKTVMLLDEFLQVTPLVFPCISKLTNSLHQRFTPTLQPPHMPLPSRI